MNLAWSIHQSLLKAGDSRGLADKDVLVVGAGLAGLTSAVAVSLFGSLVTVHDRQTTFLGDMATAAHREIHPTINFWPLDPITVSTEFPFFNWYQDSCDRILQRIKNEWDGHRSKHNILGPHLGSEVTAPRLDNGRWEVNVKETDGKEYISTYDIVLLATGFGHERDTGVEDPGYWNFAVDPIRHIQVADANPFTNYVISGTGDGGLIEAFRLLFKTFRAGRIESATVPIVTKPAFVNLVRKVEAKARQYVLDNVLHEGKTLTNDFKDEMSTRLWKDYCDLVSKLRSSPMVDELKEVLSSIGHVTLIGRRPTPLEFGAAPYHRLLITLCIMNGWATYYQVADTQISPSAIRHAIPSGEVINARTVTINALKVIDAKGERVCRPVETFVFEDALYLRRHGAVTPLDNLFPSAEDRTRIRRIQALYADQDWMSMGAAAYYAERLDLASPADPIDWANNFIDLATDYFKDRHGLDVELTDTDGKGEFVLKTNGPHFDPLLFASNQRLIPDTFLRIKVSEQLRPFPTVTDPSGFDD
jgi:Pyridine nucleotide-disulphide oxidoreductase